MEEGSLRKDLFYRLNVFTINLPPLRERRDDILLLAKSFLEEYRKDFSKESLSGFDEESIKLLEAYDFPGNVRELRNIIERAALLENSNWVTPASLPDELRKNAANFNFKKESNSESITDVGVSEAKPWQRPDFDFKNYIDSIEKQIILGVLAETGGKKSKAAEKLGLTRFALRHQMKKHGILDE